MKIKSIDETRQTTSSPVYGGDFCSGLVAEKAELAGVKGVSISVKTLKIGLLLAAVDGCCDANEIRKFRTLASVCGGFSDAKISQIIAQTKRRISIIEEAAKHGVSEDDVVRKFMSEAVNIGIEPDCRNFVLWMSIAMVDGKYSSIERKAIKELQHHVTAIHPLALLGRSFEPKVSDTFLKRCEMILSDIYKAYTMKSERMIQNRMKSLQTLVEIEEA